MNKSLKFVLIVAVLFVVVFMGVLYKRNKKRGLEFNQSRTEQSVSQPTNSVTNGGATNETNIPNTSVDQELNNIENSLNQVNPDDSNLQDLGGL